MSYVELMDFVGVTNTGKFNYHLKILGDLIEKDQNGKYNLTEKGQMAVQLLQKFPEKKSQLTSLCMADAALIGFGGVVLTIVNPVFWISLVVALLKLKLIVPFFFILAILGFMYALIVPGAVMWLLTVRRACSHDMYDLLKPPLATFILLLLLLIVIFLLGINLTVEISSPEIPTSDGVYSGATVLISLQSFMLWGLVFSFSGVVIAEFASKVRKRIML
jgi:hypothetical protein